MKKIITCLIVSFFILSNSAYANENSNEYKSFLNENVSTRDILDSDFEIDDTKTIILDNEENKMLIEFVNQEQALDKIKNWCPNIISAIKNKFNLGDLSEDNWDDYYDGLYEILDYENYNNIDYEGEDEYILLRSFFDIFENKYQNELVIEMAANRGEEIIKSKDTSSLDAIIAENLPRDAPFKEKYYDINNRNNTLHKDNPSDRMQTFSVKRPMDIQRAVTYASQYAYNPNSNYYYFRRGDCANFVSQIMENSGLRQVKSDSVFEGWWHKYNSNTHTHSRSWTIADRFASYLGVGLTRTNHRNFSANIEKGDIILADWENDGVWDHVAFVTDADNYVGSYGYYDYKVAQHTNNYHLRVSDSKNHWENAERNNCKYGRIRF